MGSSWMIVPLGSKSVCVFPDLERKLIRFDSSRRSPLLQDQAVQKRVWSELSEKLEKIQPGILQNL